MEQPDFSQDGWYRIQGYVYLGPDKPETIVDDLLLIETIDLGNLTERRIYQNSGASLDVGGQVIPDKTWTWIWRVW